MLFRPQYNQDLHTSAPQKNTTIALFWTTLMF